VGILMAGRHCRGNATVELEIRFVCSGDDQWPQVSFLKIIVHCFHAHLLAISAFLGYGPWAM
jgi:hypothetical protein